MTEIFVTNASGEEAALASAAIEAGFTTIIAAGGDGTSSNIANAILHAGRNTRLGIIASGTGNDFAKTLCCHATSVRELARDSISPSNYHVDAGLIDNRYFLNSCGFGFDVAVLERASRARWLRGRTVYATTALRLLHAYPGFMVRAGESEPRRHLMLVVANAPLFGGVFTIAPGASTTDGLLDVISVGDASTPRRAALFAATIRGTHGRFREVSRDTTEQIELRFDAVPFYQADGELRRATAATISVRCKPAALRVMKYS